MVNIQFFDGIFYGKVNENHDIDEIFNSSSSSSSIDDAERSTRKLKIDLLELVRIYLSLPEKIKITIDSYFNISPKIRELIEYKATHIGETQSEVAESLGIARSTLYNRITELEQLGSFTDALQLITLKYIPEKTPEKHEAESHSSSGSSISTSETGEEEYE